MRKTSIERQRGHNVEVKFVAALVTGVFAACSGGGEFKSTPAPAKNDPDASIESGAGGATGSGGAGAGGAPVTGGATNGGGPGATEPTDAGKDASEGGLPPPACVRDEDCAPFICSGTASCVEGVCAPGGPCESPDGGPCVNECVRTATGASCVSMGRDADGDGHRDAQCAENPGDDCDDTQPAVYAGATEVCDGLDNDCNRHADVFDGLPVGGSNQQIATVKDTAQLALAMRTSGYALLTNEMVDFYGGIGKPSDVRLLNFAGEAWKTIRISPSPNMADPSIAASGDDLVLFGFMDISPDRFLAATRRLGSNDLLQEPVLFATYIPSAQIWGRAIAGLPGGDLILAWAEHPTAAGSTLYGGIAVAPLSTSPGLGRTNLVRGPGQCEHREGLQAAYRGDRSERIRRGMG